MGVPKSQVTKNRQAIVDTAARVFRERGVDGVGVADLMKEAGFTHGGFYNHFASKDALAAEACACAFEHGAATLRAAIDADADGGTGGLRALMEDYLTPEHCSQPGTACPTASLAVDAARQGHEMQIAYARGVEEFIDAIAMHLSTIAAAAHNGLDARENAIARLAGLVGTLVLARGVGPANPALSSEILAAGRKHLAEKWLVGKAHPDN